VRLGLLRGLTGRPGTMRAGSVRRTTAFGVHLPLGGVRTSTSFARWVMSTTSWSSHLRRALRQIRTADGLPGTCSALLRTDPVRAVGGFEEPSMP
jgi:hypothetical protein